MNDLFETHVTVSDLERAMDFYSRVVGLELADLSRERRVAFYWMGGRGKSMLGLWETGTGPQKMSLHLAFRAELEDVLAAPARLQSVGVQAVGFNSEPASEPVVLAWMPAASVFFRDPDGNQLELLSMLPDAPQPELGVICWSQWKRRSHLMP